MIFYFIVLQESEKLHSKSPVSIGTSCIS